MRYAIAALASVWLLLAGTTSMAAEPISFTKQVAPLLVKNCVACHAAKDFKGGYQLHTFEALMTPGESTSASIEPGKLADSYLWDLLTSDDKDVRMPKGSDKLPADQLAIIKQWIEEGAKFDSPDPKVALASIIPKAAHPAAPEVYRAPLPITAVAYRPDGQELAVGGYHEVTIWNPNDGKLIRRLGNLAERTYGLAYSSDGNLLAVASGTPGQLGEVKLIQPSDGTLVRDLATLSDVAFDVAFSPDGKRVAACGADRSIRVFDVATGKQELLIEDHADWVLAVAWSPDGTHLASGSRDKTSKVFNMTSGESEVTYANHGDTVYGVTWSEDGKQVYSVGADKQIQMWNIADGKKANNIGGYGRDIYKIIRSGNLLFTVSGDKNVRMHDANERKQLKQFGGHQDWIYTVSYDPTTKRLATGSYDGEVRIWNTEDGKEVLKFVAAPGLAEKLAAAQAEKK